MTPNHPDHARKPREALEAGAVRDLSTAEVRALLQADDAVLVDARSPDAYNGWILHGEERGGHVPGARNLPARWTTYLDWFEIVGSRDLAPGERVVVYGSGDDDVARVVDGLLAAGFQHVDRYPAFVAEWTRDPDLPLERLARFEHLVPPDWLHQRLEGGAEGADGGLVVCHCHYRNPDDYAAGHVPGAIALDTLALEAPETWNRRGPDELREALGAHGIEPESTVVLYGRYGQPTMDDPFPGASAGQIAAMRCALILRYAGVADVRVLNGGLRVWEDAGYPTTSEATEPEAVGFDAPIPAKPELLLDTPEVKAGLADGSLKLVSVRSPAEEAGQVSGYHYIEARGRIPGAVHVAGGTDAYHMERFRNLDRTSLAHPRVEAMLRRAGLDPADRIAFFCGTGWRAAEAWFNAWLLGWPNVAVYDGGWFEWSNDPANPIEAGPHAEAGP